jgi:imidazolonepropionase
MKILIKNISCLVQTEHAPKVFVSGSEMSSIGTIENGWLTIKDGIIDDFGQMRSMPESKDFETIDASGKLVFPSFCDSHTHIVYAGSREKEFVDKIRGLTYEQISVRGGGILNSAKKLHETSDEELLMQSSARINEIIRMGTGAVEIKSGYFG